MKKSDPIGVFDSGLGGLSVVDAIHRELPEEDILFFGDSAHNPYGEKSREEITGYCQNICDDFMNQNVKAVVIACNTATSACVPLLRETYPVDIIGMEPALKVAASLGEHQKIAVWATNLTLHEEKFSRLLGRFNKDHTITKVPCPRLVQLVEHDELDNKELVKEVLMEYLEASDWQNVDSIVLGCTHFIFFGQFLKDIVGSRVKIVEGNLGTARHLRDLLEKKDLLNDKNEEGIITVSNSNPDQIPLSHRLLQRLEDTHEF